MWRDPLISHFLTFSCPFSYDPNYFLLRPSYRRLKWWRCNLAVSFIHSRYSDRLSQIAIVEPANVIYSYYLLIHFSHTVILRSKVIAQGPLSSPSPNPCPIIFPLFPALPVNFCPKLLPPSFFSQPRKLRSLFGKWGGPQKDDFIRRRLFQIASNRDDAGKKVLGWWRRRRRRRKASKVQFIAEINCRNERKETANGYYLPWCLFSQFPLNNGIAKGEETINYSYSIWYCENFGESDRTIQPSWCRPVFGFVQASIWLKHATYFASKTRF